MCLVIVGWHQHPEFPLIVAGNRDEFHARPTQNVHWWPDRPSILGGRDLQAGGTWLALDRDGRFATVTNFRDAVPTSAKFRTRGELVTDFLLGSLPPLEYLHAINGDDYAGFNLLVGDSESLAYYSNRGGSARSLPDGIYGLSNALLDSPWHKVTTSKVALGRLIDSGRIDESGLFRILDNREKCAADEVDSTQLPFAKAHAISAPFIVMSEYGTRSSSVVLQDNVGNCHFHERRFDHKGHRIGESSFVLSNSSR